jgi:hypothetical protein
MAFKHIIGIIIFPLVGIILLIGSVFSFTSTKTFLKNSIATNGTIVEVVMEKSTQTQKGHVTYYYKYYPKVSFAANDGNEYTFVSNIGSNKSPYSPGQGVKVLYDQKNPQNAKINKFIDIWLGPLLFFIIGLAFLILGLSTGISFIRKNRDSQATSLK